VTADFTYALDGDDPSAVPDDIDIMRLLLNDVDVDTMVFTDSEIKTFLLLESGAVKLAAAQAIDTNADNEALASKVLRTQDLTTDGAKLAQVMHARAEQLRSQHAATLEDGGFFGIVDADAGCGPELTHRSWY
jgi:hypothetical protein